MLLFKVLAMIGTCTLLTQTQAQSLLSAISTYSELTQFSNLLASNPVFATSLLSSAASAPKTLLIPNDNAFLSYQTKNGVSLATTLQNSTSFSLFEQVLKYHTLNGSYAAASFAPEKGATIPTLLTGETYNNRSSGSALNSASAGQKDGQVVFIAPDAGSSTFTVRARQLESEASFVQSGFGRKVNLTATEGVWDGGLFHVVDGFLTLPANCTTTIKAWNLNALSASLQRTGLAPVLDTTSNGPNDAAFLAAGSPDTKLNTSDLTNAVLFHTIPQPLYSNFLESGQTFTTASNDTVRVTFLDGDIYFNDAKVLKANVLTNNGLMHVLDRIMGALSDSPTPTANSSKTASATPSSNPTGTTKSTSTTTAFTQVPTGAAVGTLVQGNVRVLTFAQLIGAVVWGLWV